MDHAAASGVYRVVTSNLHQDRQRPISEYKDVPGDVSTHILAQPSFLSYFCPKQLLVACLDIRCFPKLEYLGVTLTHPIRSLKIDTDLFHLFE
ncbi:hypothetical protein HN011_011597 [Eciton burchellii]|nr:hypothetical protein HN011_011597 [Eciton burchellii]